MVILYILFPHSCYYSDVINKSEILKCDTSEHIKYINASQNIRNKGSI